MAGESKPHGMAYQASSPDEAALVSSAADFGFVFNGRSNDPHTISVNGRAIEIMAELEFTSDRKRSSVIIRHPESGDLVLYCKGADDLIYERLSSDSPYRDITARHLREFAMDGLRTLCCAYRVIDERTFMDWYVRYNEALGVIHDHDRVVAEVCDEIEQELLLIGATAIEDKLQLDVADTITSLLEAEITVWVLTGDKRETAINIGFACGVISSSMSLVILDATDPDELRRAIGIQNNAQLELAMIASGTALKVLLESELVDEFFNLAVQCRSVICCRVSPSQKAQVVNLIRHRTGKLTLAIGDGANDVEMIRQADVGIGLCGKEGREAVLASDYSFGEFRFLKQLLLFTGD
jgi:phospholipid-translocating P-type ATPase (flippase)